MVPPHLLACTPVEAWSTFLCTTRATLGVACNAGDNATPTIGFLSTRSPEEAAIHTTAFRSGLEEMGYVERDFVTCDTRKRWVKLTTKGRARILRAIRQFIGWGYAQLALESALEPERWHSRWRAHVAVSQAEEFLRKVRLGFGDRASLVVYTSGLRDDRLPRAATLASRWVS